ncbi:MAG: hypothetical protein AAFX58_08270 [Pseudomonadota bacterium]
MTILSLWLPILLAAVGVWIASSIVWMVLPHHKSDFRGLPDEPAARKALAGAPPGQYNLPYFADRADMTKPDGKRLMDEGPVGLVTIWPNGLPAMGKLLGIWFVYCIVVGAAVAYVATRTLAPGAEYLEVFRITGTVAWLAYGSATVHQSVWFGQPWSTTFKHLADALLYALVTAGIFGWLWA